MNPETFVQGMYGGVSVIHPLGLFVALVAGVLTLFLPRRYAILPLVVAGLFLPMAQRIVIFDLDLTVLRMLALLGFARAFKRGEYREIRLNGIDRAMVAWILAGTLIYTLLHGTTGAFINRMGTSLDALGVYLLTRFFVRDVDDILRVVKTLAVSCIVISIAMLNEQFTRQNLFAAIGVPELTQFRSGNLRSHGPFAHPILAGTFGATLVPIFWTFRRQSPSRKLALIASAAAILVVFTSASSGPLIACLAGLFGLFSWGLRKHMRLILLSTAIGLAMLHLIMKAPVWALLGRFAVVSGSTGFHRFLLFDQFVRRFDEWWLLGTPSTDHWGYLLFDVTNMFVRVAVSGGLLTLLLFIVIIWRCFRAIGAAVRQPETHPVFQKFVWSFGASLFAHVVSFMSVAYFDQIIIIWYWLLATIAILASSPAQSSSVAPASTSSSGLEPLNRFSPQKMPTNSNFGTIKPQGMEGHKPGTAIP